MSDELKTRLDSSLITHHSSLITVLMVSFDPRDAIAFIRLEELSALTGVRLAELGERFESMRREPHLRAVILTGAGAPAFGAGAESASASAEEAREVARRGQRVCELIENCGVPVIAAVGGLAAGGGFELALA